MRNIPSYLIKDKTYCVNYIVFQNEHGSTEFLYIAVREDHMPEFKEAIKNGNFDAEDYGYILEHGKGEASNMVKEKMKLLYKCNPDINYKVQTDQNTDQSSV